MILKKIIYFRAGFDAASVEDVAKSAGLTDYAYTVHGPDQDGNGMILIQEDDSDSSRWIVKLDDGTEKDMSDILPMSLIPDEEQPRLDNEQIQRVTGVSDILYRGGSKYVESFVATDHNGQRCIVIDGYDEMPKNKPNRAQRRARGKQ